MKKDILSWNDVKELYLKFHLMDEFTENMAIDVDFGYWLVNNCIIPDVVFNEVENCPKCLKPKRMKPNTIQMLCECVDSEVELPLNYCTLNISTCHKGSGCKYPHCHL